jgi:YHS domain-containing protein
MNRDPVCGKRINRNRAYVSVQHEGHVYYLCCPLCQREFERDPREYATAASRGRRLRRTPTRP